MKKLVLLFGLLAILTSCGTIYQAKYAVGLNSVESPADAKQQFGETKVVNFSEADLTKYRYEDDYIDIVWFVGLKQFNFVLKNKSNHTIKINWDDISYVDIKGNTGRVMHSGVKYVDRNASQPASSIPKGASLTDIILPVDNVYFVSGQYGGWREKLLIPAYYKSKEAMEQEAPTYVGKQMKILMPISIESVQNDYTFVFNIDELLPNK